MALDILASVIPDTWSIFTGLQVPGLEITYAEWFVAVLTISITVSIVRLVFGFGGSGTGQRSGHSGKKYISEKRKGDEK